MYQSSRYIFNHTILIISAKWWKTDNHGATRIRLALHKATYYAKVEVIDVGHVDWLLKVFLLLSQRNCGAILSPFIRPVISSRLLSRGRTAAEGTLNHWVTIGLTLQNAGSN